MRPMTTPDGSPDGTGWTATLDPDVPFTVPVGPLLYEVRLVAGPLVDVDGIRCATWIEHGRRTISVDAGVPLHALPLVAAAAVATAWQQVTAAAL